MNNHTSKPWFLDGSVVYSPIDERIAVISTDPVSGFEAIDGDWKSNARLIVYSPDMYELITEIYNELVERKSVSNETEQVIKKLIDKIDKI